MNPLISGSVRGLVCLLLLTCFASSQNPTAKAARKLSELNTQLLKKVQTATPEVKQAVSQVPAVNPVEVHEIPAPQNPEKTIAVVSESQKRILLSAVNNFTSAKKKQQTEYSALALTFIIAGACLALLASIFSFRKWNTIAGTISLIVFAVVSFTKVYPMPALADFYGALATQAVALQTDCELKDPFTKDDYDSAEHQLKYLIVYEAENSPKLGTTTVSTDELAKQIQTYKTSANVAATGAQ